MAKKEKIYQDVYLDGVIVQRGTRDSEERYDAIAKVLRRYKRPFTLLDIGASEGYFSFRATREFDAIAVMIEKRSRLQENCRKSVNDRVILLHRQIGAGELKRLSEVEHFDVVLALNVIHHFGWRWKTAARAVFDLGDTIIVENPPDDDTGSRGKYIRAPINRFLDGMPHEKIVETKRRRAREILSTVRLYERRKTRLTRPFLGGSFPENRGAEIESDYESKRHRDPRSGTTRDWIHGINLTTFKRLGGVHPSMEKLKPQIDALLSAGDRELAIWDLILSGHKLEPLDPTGPPHPDHARGHSELLRFVGS